MTHIPVILASVALVLSAVGLLLTLLLRLSLAWPTQDAVAEQQADVANGWKKMLKINLACLTISTLLWLMAAYLPVHKFGLLCLFLFLALSALGKLWSRLGNGASVGGRR